MLNPVEDGRRCASVGKQSHVEADHSKDPATDDQVCEERTEDLLRVRRWCCQRRRTAHTRRMVLGFVMSSTFASVPRPSRMKRAGSSRPSRSLSR